MNDDRFEVDFYVMDNETGRWGFVVEVENEWAMVHMDDGDYKLIHFDDLVDEETYDTYERLGELEEAGIYNA